MMNGKMSAHYRSIINRCFLSASSLFALAVLSCSREVDFTINQQVEFYAAWAEEEETRTQLQSDGTSVWWSAGDEINVFYGAVASGKFTASNTEAVKYARFTGMLPVMTGATGEGNDPESFWGVYPYDAANSCDGESVFLTVSDTQSGIEGTFAEKTFPAIGKSKDFAITFYNVCGGARFSVANKGIRSVTFKAIGGENLAGLAKVAFGKDGKPVVQQVTEGFDEVTVTAPAGGFVPGQFYFAVFLPGTLAKGLKITYRTASQSADYLMGQSIQVNRSRFGTIDKKDEGLALRAYSIPEAIDLGLPSGVKWASFNLGATKPEEYGDYFAWGETEPYYTSVNPLVWKAGYESGYDWPSYKYCIGAEYALTKYCNDSSYGFNGFVDNKSILDPEDDAAYVNLGGSWRTPKIEELEELARNCTWKWEPLNGVNGYMVTGVNGNRVFIPAAGGGFSTDIPVAAGVNGGFWLSTFFPGYAGFACILDFGSNYLGWNIVYRYYGISVRPVQGPPSTTIPVESVSLEKTEIDLAIGESINLVSTIFPTNATNTCFYYSSNDTSVATVSGSIITGVGAGIAVITVTTMDGGKTATCIVTVSEPYSSAIPEAIDLGLPSGTKWASFNLGATKPEEYGDYFAWGETEPYYFKKNPLTWKIGKDEGYDWPSYKWCMGTENTLIKYCTNADYGYYGYTDNKTALDLDDDAANMHLGGRWRMPTANEQSELVNNCTWTWGTMNGVEGHLVTGPNGNSIFLPATGGFNPDGYSPAEDISLIGLYWSSSLYTIIENPIGAYFLHTNSEGAGVQGYFRCLGFTIRPVYDASEMMNNSAQRESLPKASVGYPRVARVLDQVKTSKSLMNSGKWNE